MTSMLVDPQFVASAASDVTNIGSVIGEAKAAASGPTTGLVVAAEDEVSVITAQFFGAYGREYQGLLQQAAVFHQQFAAALAGAQATYVEAETSAISLLGGTGPVSTAVSTGTSGPVTLLAGDPAFTLVMGGSGLPIPGQPYINDVVSRYIAPFFTPGTVSGLFTPEGLYPLTAVKDLTLNVSVSRGVTILNQQIQNLVASGSNTINVLGYSQSAIISSLEMSALNPTNTPGGSLLPPGVSLNFSLIGDPMNPNGGLLARFAGLSLPSMGLTFYGATPANSFPTHITTLEYDGYADFPQYPINFLSDLNAFMGIAFVHGTYPTLTSTAGITLPTSGPTSTTYTMIPVQNLPLLDPVRAIPVVGKPIADLLQPDLSVLVNIGYGSTTQGWSTGPANVPTPFGVIPPVTPGQVISALAAGTPQGISAFMNDVDALGVPSLPSLASTGSIAMNGLGLPAALTAAQLSPTSIIESLETANTTVVNGISTVASNLYATLLPTADIANALVTAVPSYDVNLFLNGILQAINGDPTGGLIYAFGAPIAADVALGTLAGGFETEVLLGALGISL